MKFCKDCRFYNGSSLGWMIELDKGSSCSAQIGGTIDLVTGEYNSIGKRDAYKMRNDANLCGPDGSFFIQKEKIIKETQLPVMLPQLYKGF